MACMCGDARLGGRISGLCRDAPCNPSLAFRECLAKATQTVARSTSPCHRTPVLRSDQRILGPCFRDCSPDSLCGQALSIASRRLSRVSKVCRGQRRLFSSSNAARAVSGCGAGQSIVRSATQLAPVSIGVARGTLLTDAQTDDELASNIRAMSCVRRC